MYRNSFTSIVFVFTILSFSHSFAQVPFGISINDPLAMESYTLLENNSKTYLIDNCGEIINIWNINNTRLHSKLLPNGNLIYIKDNAIHIVNWDDVEIETIENTFPGTELDYEVIVMPNGNYLCVARRFVSNAYFESIGWRPLVFEDPDVVDMVIEFDKDDYSVVWSWDISQHVIQQRDANAPNYGVLSDHPELLNMDGVDVSVDWQFYESFMINGMDYNHDLDQIALSVRKMSEVVIIDHATTTLEASGHTGGKYGKGGDILYRWGNPKNYNMGTDADRELYFQHNPNWIKYGEHAGKLIIHNNGLARPDVFTSMDRYSSADIIELPIDSDGNYTRAIDQPYAPNNTTRRYTDRDGDVKYYSGYTSGAKILPNGHLFVTQGVDGRLFEVDADDNIVWQYKVPGVSYIFRAEKYSLDYPAFEGQNLSLGGTIESPSSSYDCMLSTGISDLHSSSQLWNIFHSNTMLILESPERVNSNLQMFNVNGQLVAQEYFEGTYHTVSLEHYVSGIYFVYLRDLATGKYQKEKIFINKVF